MRFLTMGIRRGIEEALDHFERGRDIILIAPTGYGKTQASPMLLEVARNAGRAVSLIHVVPLRTLVKRIVEEKFSREVKRHAIGYQSMDRIRGYAKSPYFLRDLIVTTLDSFLLNLYRIPVAEAVKIARGSSQGHVFAGLAPIFSSMVVFDEAHMYTGGYDERTPVAFVRAALGYLSELGVPVVIETATMHSELVLDLYRLLEKRDGRRPAVIYVGGPNKQLDRLRDRLRGSFVEVRDEDFENINSIRWRTEIVDEPGALELARNLCRERAVIVIRNTIEKAVRTYEEIGEKADCDAVLIHSLLSNRDRARAEERIGEIQRRGRGLVVATQVMEAGVEGEASILITDAAPIENLAQRAGRLCRYRGYDTEVFRQCREGGGEIYIVRPVKGLDGDRIDVYSAQRVLQAIESIERRRGNGFGIDWRLLSDLDGRASFADMIEEESPPGYGFAMEVRQNLFKDLLMNSETPDVLFRLLEDLGVAGLIREDFLVRLSYGDPRDPDDLWGSSVSVELTRLLEYERKRIQKGGDTCLEYDHNGRASIFVAVYDERDRFIGFAKRSSKKLSMDLIVRRSRGLGFRESYQIYESAESPREGYTEVGMFIALKKQCYEEERGLVIWRGERSS